MVNFYEILEHYWAEVREAADLSGATPPGDVEDGEHDTAGEPEHELCDAGEPEPSTAGEQGVGTEVVLVEEEPVVEDSQALSPTVADDSQPLASAEPLLEEVEDSQVEDSQVVRFPWSPDTRAALTSAGLHSPEGDPDKNSCGTSEVGELPLPPVMDVADFQRLDDRQREQIKQRVEFLMQLTPITFVFVGDGRVNVRNKHQKVTCREVRPTTPQTSTNLVFPNALTSWRQRIAESRRGLEESEKREPCHPLPELGYGDLV